jgi:pimeloyl-ACP methyl ester carboxylesterase
MLLLHWLAHSNAPGQGRENHRMTPRERTITTGDGLKLFFRDWGDPFAGPPPLLCLPGLTRNSLDFVDLAQRYAPNRRVICPDWRGRGRSDYDPDWRRYHPRVYVEDLRHLLAALGVSRVVAVGTSMGGLVATALAALLPGVVAGVVLNDIGPDPNRDGIERIVEYIGRDRPQPDWDAAVAELRRLMPGVKLQGDAAWRRFAEASYQPGPDGLLHFAWDVNLARPFAEAEPIQDLWPLFRGLADIPALAVRGEISDVLSAETFERMGAELPHLIRVTVPGWGHCPTLGEAEVLPALDAFVEAIG